ncbi:MULTISPECIES: NUDIX domain-containing protein [unclassified Kaistella]|uniref:NUDIX hydrolase n=1 Tax=unclassified Kaistella TaxID=2762626 RepID=UPI0027331E3F|nr:MULTISPECIES: NUDIX domain-containing protein [unclassified Kaistella]MCZ2083405.1 NUDIX domain-containing protein [Flavobacteriales bacterium]MDP2453864.1 NUDIX domain-containing protein [Kaistella sp. SH11-4b]MDP2456921.1 NUDIX domain-containing protein [Kaistella sp. SH40-3]MDP2459678.1 NUDIX domain-containing protein [Kaistella sp. SH19-2b]
MKIDDTKIKQSLQELIDTKDFVQNLSVDCVIFGFHDDILKILLLKYHDLDLWSLPGGFVFNDEHLDDAAFRVLYERTHLENIFLQQFHTFGRIDRTENNVHEILLKNKNIDVSKDHWILQRFITVGYCSLIDFSLVDTFPDAFNESCAWFEVSDLPKMAFDHNEIIAKGLEHIRKNIDTQMVASNLLPEKFTMKELQTVYETVLGEKFRRNNFQRKILAENSLERLEKFFDGSPNKAPYLYRFITEEE